jgi:cephalosporin hydroxylase
MIDRETVTQKWHANKTSGKRAFHDKYPDFIRVAQQVFENFTADNSATWVPHTAWFDVGAIQIPSDYLMYVEVLQMTRPKVVVECGSMSGGSAAIWAEMLRRIVGPGSKVITIELYGGLQERFLKSDPNIVSLVGDSTSPEMAQRVQALIPDGWPTMVTLDSAHDGLHVCKEIGSYAPMVTSGHYLIVQDTFLGLCWGGNVLPGDCRRHVKAGNVRAFDYHNCPLGAVETLLDTSDDFSVDLGSPALRADQHPFG